MGFKQISGGFDSIAKKISYPMLWVIGFAAWVIQLYLGSRFISFLALLVCLAIIYSAVKFHSGRRLRSGLILITAVTCVLIGFFSFRSGSEVTIADGINVMDAQIRMIDAMNRSKR
jgi:apolipoprotein N-acyltransferase